MKKQRHCTIALFIGLLSFNILSSCANSRQELGLSLRGVKKFYRNNPKKVWVAGGTVGVLVVSGLAYLLWPTSTLGSTISPSTRLGGTTLKPLDPTRVDRNDFIDLPEGAKVSVTTSSSEATSGTEVSIKADNPIPVPRNDYSLQTIKSFVKKGGKGDAIVPGPYEFPVWRYVIESTNTDSLAFLLDNGLNVNAIDKKGYSLLYLAVQIGDDRTIALLLDRGANVNTILKGSSPLLVAIEHKKLYLVKRLIDLGAFLPSISEIRNELPMTEPMRKLLISAHKKSNAYIENNDKTLVDSNKAYPTSNRLPINLDAPTENRIMSAITNRPPLPKK